VIVECAVYEDGQRREGDIALRDACEAGQEPGAFVWIDLYEPSADEFRALREEFDLHPLAVEDALVAHERPKLERYGDMRFVVLKTACYDDDRETVDFGEVMLFAGESFAITVRHGAATDLEDLRDEIERDGERMRRGALAVVHAVVDKVVDDYEPVVAGLQGDIDEVEQGLFSDVNAPTTKRIYRLGREVLEFSRAVQPLVDPVRRLARGDLPGERSEEMLEYFRDVQDHLERVDGWVAAQRELLSNLLQANLTQVTIAQNADMRRISAWVAIVAVPTAIAGIYGMNFEHMPELRWRIGYPLVIGLILLICTTLYVRFKRSGWL
jgi:magnesium transporter